MKTVGKWAVAVSFLIFLILEVWFSADKNALTWPLTREIVEVLPYPVTAAIIAWFIAWAPRHFGDAYRKEGTMKRSWELEPVKWMSIILGILVALESVQEFVDLLPEKVNAYVLIAIAVLTAVLGIKVRGKVTPLAAPRDNKGRELVPVPAGAKPRGPMRSMGG